jgi:hypothetical protein
VRWLLLRRGECEKVGADPVEVAHIDALKFLVPVCISTVCVWPWANLLLETEVFEPAETFFLGLPYAINDVLDVQDIVSLAVPGVAERHAGRVHLRNGCQGKMRRPRLDEHHVARQNARRVSATCLC